MRHFFSVVVLVGLALSGTGCGTAKAPSTDSAAVTGAVAAKPATAPRVAASASSSVAKPTVKKVASEAEIPAGPVVLVYNSEATAAYLEKSGVDAGVSSRVWEGFLRKYQIPFARIKTAEALDKAKEGVLLLPTTIVLSDVEKNAIAAFRSRGGAVLSTGHTGVRDQSGAWIGTDFMEKTLDVKVAGDTTDTPDEVFMSMRGDNPVSHFLPAGQRVWLPRDVKGVMPLRLVGKHYAANIMEWGRRYEADRPSGIIVYDERPVADGKHSRGVVFGFSDYVWLAADPKLIEAIAHNTLMWLLRQPDVYLSAWPHPKSSALVMAVESAEPVADVDLEFAMSLEAVGGKGTYFTLGENVAKAAPVLKKIQSRGHEVAYFGDKFEGYKGLADAAQRERLSNTKKSFDAAGVAVAPTAGFNPPMGDFDATTEKIALDSGFAYMVGHQGSTDTRLPYLIKSADGKQSMIGLAITQSNPERAFEEDPETGIDLFAEELDLLGAMGGLAVVTIPSQTILPNEQREKMFSHLKTLREKVWMAPAAHMAQWWRERARISARMDIRDNAAILVVTVRGKEPLKGPSASVLVNLPSMNGRLRLQSPQADNPTPVVAKLDAWRAVVILGDLDPGEYCWNLQFDGVESAKK